MISNAHTTTASAAQAGHRNAALRELDKYDLSPTGDFGELISLFGDDDELAMLCHQYGRHFQSGETHLLECDRAAIWRFLAKAALAKLNLN